MLKVIYVLDSFFPHTVGGTEYYTLYLAKYMTKSGNWVNIVVPDYTHPTGEKYVYEDIHVRTYYEPSKTDRDLLFGRKQPKAEKN
ncbi:MAG: glycosyltransferase family 4 protein [Bacteroidales bacterium]|nr:glycosyltransferase family 4 protein [Bacteroidales bacterium]